MSPLDTVKPRCINEPLYNEILGIMNNFLDPSTSKDSKIYGKEARYYQLNLFIANRFCQSRELSHIAVSLYQLFGDWPRVSFRVRLSRDFSRVTPPA